MLLAGRLVVGSQLGVVAQREMGNEVFAYRFLVDREETVGRRLKTVYLSYLCLEDEYFWV